MRSPGPPRQSPVAVPIAPPAECPLADPQQLRRLHLAQLRPLRAANNVRQTLPTDPLANASPAPCIPPPLEAHRTGHFTS